MGGGGWWWVRECKGVEMDGWSGIEVLRRCGSVFAATVPGSGSSGRQVHVGGCLPGACRCRSMQKNLSTNSEQRRSVLSGVGQTGAHLHAGWATRAGSSGIRRWGRAAGRPGGAFLPNCSRTPKNRDVELVGAVRRPAPAGGPQSPSQRTCGPGGEAPF